MSPREHRLCQPFRELSAEECQNCLRTTLFRWSTLNQEWNITPYKQYKRQKKKRIPSCKNDQHATPRNDAQKRSRNVHVSSPHRRPCFNCGENNHLQNQCRFNARLEYYQCHSLGHKARLCCWMNSKQYSQERHWEHYGYPPHWY